MVDRSIDKVRASRDGHQDHEAWLARRALGDNVTTAADLTAGTLVRPLKEALRPQNSAHYILGPAGGVLSKPTQAFMDWLTAEAMKNDMPSSLA